MNSWLSISLLWPHIQRSSVIEIVGFVPNCNPENLYTGTLVFWHEPPNYTGESDGEPLGGGVGWDGKRFPEKRGEDGVAIWREGNHKIPAIHWVAISTFPKDTSWPPHHPNPYPSLQWIAIPMGAKAILNVSVVQQSYVSNQYKFSCIHYQNTISTLHESVI